MVSKKKKNRIKFSKKFWKNYDKDFFLVKIFFSIFIIFILYLTNCKKNDPLLQYYSENKVQYVRETLKDIPPSDKKLLKYFFKKTMFHNLMAFSLFGDKPLSFRIYHKSPILNFLCFYSKYPQILIQENRLFHQSLMTWKKYSHLFPSKNYLIQTYPSPYLKGEYEIVVINKEAFSKTLISNYLVFKRVLENEFSEKEILSQFESGKGKDFNIIRTHEGLLGILLGYGTENALNFHKRAQTFSSNLEEVFPKELILSNQKKEKASISKEELQKLNSKLFSFSNELPALTPLITLPHFAADPTRPETVQLKNQYTQERKNMRKRFKQGNVLEHFLLQYIN